MALAPLVTYRLLEHLTSRWSRGPVSVVFQHTVPPVGMLGLGLLLWRLVPPLPPREGQRSTDSLGLSVAVGILLGSMVGLFNLITMLTTQTRSGASGVTAFDPGAAALVVHVLLLAPVAEEVAFRGLIYRIFRRSMPSPGANGLSALVFGMMHVQPSKATWAFFLGLVTASSYEQTRSLLTPVLVHAMFNAVPVGVAVLRAQPDDTGPIWLALAVAALVFSLSASSAQRNVDTRRTD